MPPTDRATALNELSLEIFRLTSQLNSLADRLARDIGMTSARWQLLGTLADQGSMSVAEIARRMGLQRQSVQRTADCLVVESCIAFRQNPRHRRAKLAVITPTGEQALERLQQQHRRWVAEVRPQLDIERLQITAATLREFRQVLDGRHDSA